MKYALTVSIYHAGIVGAMATMVAFYASRYQGLGQHVDISIMETQAGSIDRRIYQLLQYQYTGKTTPRGAISGTQYPSGAFPCADGYCIIGGGGPRFPRVVELMGNPPELMDPKWYTPEAQGDPDLKEEFEAILLEFTMQHTKRELFEMGQKAGNLSAPLFAVDEVFDDSHLNQRGFFVEVEHPMTGKVKYTGRPFVMGETPWVLRRPAPLLGQHNTEVLSELGYTPKDLVMLKESGVI